MSDQLPSLDDLLESKLPSVDEFIKEEDLPSVDEFVEKEEEVIEEETIEEPVIEDAEDLTEVIRLINDVRRDIPVVPEIPEIKYYDEELKELSERIEEIRESIPEVPEQKTYDVEVEAICGLIDTLKEEVKEKFLDLPVPKYYEVEIENLQQKVNGFYQDMMDLPEPKYYEEDLKSLKEEILAVREAIPTFPKWVNEVNEVPDFKWIGKTFSVIDDDFIKVQDNLDSIKNRIDQEVQQISEDIDVKRFESKTDINKLNEDLKETKDKIYKELKEAALNIYDAKNGYKDDDRKLKKQLLNQFHVLKQNVLDEVKEFNRKNDSTKDLYGGYFDGLTQEIANLPEVKYYDEEIKEVRDEFKDGLKSLKTIVEEIKEKQQAVKSEVKDIQEGLLNEPPDEKQSVGSGDDPLAPLDKQFPNLKALADHYRLFINRTQQQLAVVGGGGAGFMKDLADVTFTESTGTNKLLIYNGDGWVGIASTALSPTITLDDALGNGNVSGIGMSVGVITATNGYFSGIVTAAQLNYDVVTDIYSTGIVTATKGIQQTGNEGLHVTAGVSTFVGLSSFQGGINVKAGSANTSLIVEGDARIIGILTIGTGSVTIDGSTNKVKIGTGVTLTSTGEADFVGVVTAAGFEVGTAATIKDNGNATFSGIVTASSFVGDGSGLDNVGMDTSNVSGSTLNIVGVVTATGGVYVGTAASIYANGNVTCGIVTATKYYGDGSSLSNVTSTTINNNANNRLITGSGTANTLEGESTLTYDGSKFSVGTGATVFTGGNIVAAGIVTANGGFVGGLTGNVTGNASGSSGSCTGNAATATILATARNIGGVSFDGSAAINLPGVNASGSQNTSGTAAGLSGTPDITVDEITARNINVTGITTFAGVINANSHIDMGDSDYIKLGDSDDLNIYHDSTNSYISNSTGQLRIAAAAIRINNAASSESIISADENGAVELYYDNSKKAETVTGGFTVTGTCTATTFSGSGASLTNIPGIPSEADTSVSSTSATTVLSIDKTAQRAAFVDVLITQGSAYQAGQYGLIHDGTTATIVEKFAMATGSMLGTLTTTISGDNMLLQVNMGSSSSATVTVKSSTLTV